MTPSPLDIVVAGTVAKVIREFKTTRDGSPSGIEFESVVFDAVWSWRSWCHTARPDELPTSLPITTRTGVRYELDGVLASAGTLDVIEARCPSGLGPHPLASGAHGEHPRLRGGTSGVRQPG